MFNFKFISFPNGLSRATFFLSTFFSHQEVSKKQAKIATPFFEPDGHIAFGRLERERTPFDIEESLRCSLSRTRKRINYIANSGNFKYFCTFTFSPESCDRYSYDEVSSCMHAFLRSLRLDYSDIQYIVVPELHKDGAFHFHGLFSDHLPVIYAGFFKRSGGHIYHIKSFTYGFSSATIISDPFRVASYITKYISKDLCAVSANKRRYWYSRSTIHVPESVDFLFSQEFQQIFLQFLERQGVKYYESKFPIPFLSVTLTPDLHDNFVEFLSRFCYGFSCSREFYGFSADSC